MPVTLPSRPLDHDGPGVLPASWETALWGLLHPTQIAIIEAQLWIELPLSATLLVGIFEDAPLNRLSHHLNRLAGAGVLRLAYTRPARGALERFYAIAR